MKKVLLSLFLIAFLASCNIPKAGTYCSGFYDPDMQGNDIACSERTNRQGENCVPVYEDGTYSGCKECSWFKERGATSLGDYGSVQVMSKDPCGFGVSGKASGDVDLQQGIKEGPLTDQDDTQSGSKVGQASEEPSPYADCFYLDETWTREDEKEYMGIAINEMLRYPGYLEKLCIDKVRLIRKEGMSGGRSPPKEGTIYFGDNSVSNEVGAIYTLAHEAGHIYNDRYPDVIKTHYDTPEMRAEGYLPTYPLDLEEDMKPFEDYPETLGIYISGDYMVFNAGSGYTRRTGKMGKFALCDSSYPVHCDFARKVVGSREDYSPVLAKDAGMADLADCPKKCTDRSFTACVGGGTYKRSTTGWVYKKDIMSTEYFTGGAEMEGGLPECSAPGLSCSKAPLQCLQKCTCAEALADMAMGSSIVSDDIASHPQALLHIYIDLSKRWLYLYDDEGKKVMDFQVAVGDDGLTSTGEYYLGEVCMDKEYCSTYTPENYPQDKYPSLYNKRESYYAGNSIFIDTCGLKQDDRERICGGDSKPIVCDQDSEASLPDDWFDQVHEVNCVDTNIPYQNSIYSLGPKKPYPGPFGIMWGRMYDLETGSFTHRGIHGTNERAILGLDETHGCVRAYNYNIWRMYKFILDHLDDEGHKDELDKVLIHIKYRFDQ